MTSGLRTLVCTSCAKLKRRAEFADKELHNQIMLHGVPEFEFGERNNGSHHLMDMEECLRPRPCISCAHKRPEYDYSAKKSVKIGGKDKIVCFRCIIPQDLKAGVWCRSPVTSKMICTGCADAQGIKYTKAKAESGFAFVTFDDLIDYEYLKSEYQRDSKRRKMR